MPILQRSLTRHPNEHRRYFTVHGSVILSKKPSGKNLILPIWPQSTLKRSTVDLLERNSHTFLVDCLEKDCDTNNCVTTCEKSVARNHCLQKKEKEKGKASGESNRKRARFVKRSKPSRFRYPRDERRRKTPRQSRHSVDQSATDQKPTYIIPEATKGRKEARPVKVTGLTQRAEDGEDTFHRSRRLEEGP